jgi:hypothetical protein
MAEKKYDYKEFGISAPEYLATKLLGVDEDVVDAAGFARSYSEENQLLDDDRTEDTLRHILLGGLIRGEDEEMTFRRGLATKYIDAREVDENRQPLNEESSIDQINNIYGLKLREKFKNRDDFIAAAKDIADAVARGEDVPELDGYTPKLSYGSTGKGFAQGGAVDTPAGEEMKEKNPNPPIPQSADLNKDGEIDQMEKMKYEAQKEVAPAEMNCGGMMADPFAPMNVVIGYDEVSGNEIPAGSMAHEVRDDVPAMLSEGEYVVPADVVRWHGLKTFEALRGEAKMAMGLMADHGRLSYVDGEEEDYEEPEYKEEEYEMEDSSDDAEDDDIEEENVEIEETEFKVAKLAEGGDVVKPSTFYRYISRLNPTTRRYEFVAVDPTTNQPVTPEAFDATRSTRYSISNLLKKVYGPKDAEEKAPVEEEKEAPKVVVSNGDDKDDDREQGGVVERTFENDFGFQAPNPIVAGVFGLINPVLGIAVKGATNFNNAQAVDAARKYLGMKPLTLKQKITGTFTGDYNSPEYTFSYDDETDSLKAMGFEDTPDSAGVTRASVREELVSRGLDPSSPTLGMTKEELVLDSWEKLNISESERKAEEDARKGGWKPEDIDIADLNAEREAALEAAQAEAERQRQQDEAEDARARAQEKAAKEAAAKVAAEERAAKEKALAEEVERERIAREYVESQKDNDRDNSGWGDDDRDSSGWGGGSGGGWGFAKGGYLARRNTPKKVLIKR